MQTPDERDTSMLIAACVLAGRCGGPAPHPPPAATAQPQPAAADDADPADDAVPAPNVRTAELLAKLMPSNGTGCAPGARCIRVTQTGKPSSAGGSIAQCRGELADFIVPRTHDPVWLRRPLVPAEPDRERPYGRPIWDTSLAHGRSARHQSAAGVSARPEKLRVRQRAGPELDASVDRRQRLFRHNWRHRAPQSALRRSGIRRHA